MGLAFRQAEAAAARDEVPIGAVLVDSTTGQVLAADHNRVEELHDLYVTLEPCPMCATAISFARLRRIVFAARDPKGGGVEHGPKIFQQPTCHHRPEVFGGLDEVKSATLLKTFFQSKR